MAALGRGQGDLPGRSGEYHGVQVKQFMAQGELPSLFQGIRRPLWRHLQRRAEHHLARGAGLRESQLIVLKGQPLLQGDVKTGMTAHTAVQWLLRPVFHLEGHLQHGPLQSIPDAEGKAVGVNSQCLWRIGE